MNTEAIDLSALYITNKVRGTLPIDDLLEWLINEHPEAELKQVLPMLNAVYQGGFTIAPAAEEKKTYQIGDRKLEACPQRVLA